MFEFSSITHEIRHSLRTVLLSGVPGLFLLCEYAFVPLVPATPETDEQPVLNVSADTISPSSPPGIPGIPTIPRAGNYNVYYGDLHNHTAISDGSGTPAEAFTYARNISGLDFFGISDHCWSFTAETWRTVQAAADSCNEDSSFVTFGGFEWTSMYFGHVTVVGSDDWCTAMDTATDTFSELCEWLAPRNALAFFNHPGRSGSFDEFDRFEGPVSDRFVGMELFNKSAGFHIFYYNDGFDPRDNNKGYYDEALSRGWHIGAAGGGDNHSASWGSYTGYRIAVLAPACTRKEISAAFMARRTYSTLDKNILLSFSADGNEMGSTVRGTRHTFTISAADMDGERFSEVVLYNGDHDIVATWRPSPGIFETACPVTVTDDDYFYVKVSQYDTDEAVSAPIWVVASE